MDYEPGPLALFTEDAIPIEGPPSDFVGLAAEQVRALEGAAGAIEGELLAMSGAADNELEGDAVLALAEAAAEHDRQSRDSDPAIVDVATAAGAGESELAGLSTELAADLNTSPPSEPGIPPDGYDDKHQPPPPPGEWDFTVRQAFSELLHRNPTEAELIASRQFEPDVAWLRAWIAAGAPIPNTVPKPEPPPPPPATDFAEWDAGVNALFRELGGRDAFDGELAYARRFYPDLEAVRAWIVAGTPQ